MREIITFLSVISALGILSVGATATVPSNETPPLPTNESAVLWSEDQDRCNARPSTSSTVAEALARCTDYTYATPPEMTTNVSQTAFSKLRSGDRRTSVYANGASPSSKGPIREAHVTIFTANPRTILHAGAQRRVDYVAPNGTLRALVDYRVETPDRVQTANKTVRWSVEAHEIEAVRFGVENTTLGTTQSTRPTFNYSLRGVGNRTLWIQARITASLRKTTIRETSDGSITTRTTTTHGLTVRDHLDVRLYRPKYDLATAESSTGAGYLSVRSTQPFVRYSAANSSDESVQSVWRFYTTGAESWQTLTTASGTTTTTNLTRRPVVVHAFAARTEPTVASDARVTSVDIRQSIWESAAAPDLPPEIDVGAVESTVHYPERLVSKHAEPIGPQVTIIGLVDGSTTTISHSQLNATSELRTTEVETTVRSRNESTVTLAVSVRDGDTGTQLRRSAAENRSVGTLSVDGQSYPLGEQGVQIVRVPARGATEIRYLPARWTTESPAYLPSETRVAFHPLTTVSGWVELLVTLLWTSIPFLVVLYAGRQLGTLVGREERR